MSGKLCNVDSIWEKNLPFLVNAFNRRLTRRMSSCRMQVIAEEQTKEINHLCGGVKINFDFLHPVNIINQIHIGKNKQNFLTKFLFSSKSILIVPFTNKESTNELIEKIIERFNIADISGQNLYLYERELSTKYRSIFYRKLEDNEKPLEMVLSWAIDKKRASLVLTDHDPSVLQYRNFELVQLEEKLMQLKLEEEYSIQEIIENYEKLKNKIQIALETFS